jgi:hypothetical protein
VPRACPAAIDATAGSTRPTTSSSDEGGSVVDTVDAGAPSTIGAGIVSSAALAVVCSVAPGTAAAGTSDATGSDESETVTAGAGVTAGSAGRMNMNAMPPAITRAPSSRRPVFGPDRFP